MGFASDLDVVHACYDEGRSWDLHVACPPHISATAATVFIALSVS